jgi:hypothetical protein
MSAAGYSITKKNDGWYYKRPDGSEEGPFVSEATAIRSSKIDVKVKNGVYLKRRDK